MACSKSPRLRNSLPVLINCGTSSMSTAAGALLVCASALKVALVRASLGDGTGRDDAAFWLRTANQTAPPTTTIKMTPAIPWTSGSWTQRGSAAEPDVLGPRSRGRGAPAAAGAGPPLLLGRGFWWRFFNPIVPG